MMASMSKPSSCSSRSVTGRTPLSLMSISTTFSHVDCIRSISNFSIFIYVFGDVQVLYSQSGEIADADSASSPGRRRFAKCADLDGPRRLGQCVLQFTQLLTLAARI